MYFKKVDSAYIYLNASREENSSRNGARVAHSFAKHKRNAQAMSRFCPTPNLSLRKDFPVPILQQKILLQLAFEPNASKSSTTNESNGEVTDLATS